MSKAFYHEPTGRVIIRGLKMMPGANDFKFKDFTGKATDQSNGTRNFCVVISEEDKNTIVEAADRAGKHINIKEYNGEFYFKVIFGKKFPPEVSIKKTLKSGKVLRTVMDEENFDDLQNALMADAELSCTPTFISRNNTWTCYLNKFNFVPLIDPLEEEELELDMADFEGPTEDEVPFD